MCVCVNIYIYIYVCVCVCVCVCVRIVTVPIIVVVCECGRYYTCEMYVQSFERANITFTSRVLQLYLHSGCMYATINLNIHVCLYFIYVYEYVGGARTVRALKELKRSLIPLQSLYLLI